MAFRDFQDKMRLKRLEAQLRFEENSGEAWQQIRAFFSGPGGWFLTLGMLMLASAAVCVVLFLNGIRAPELPAFTRTDANSEAVDRDGDGIPEDDGFEVSGADQPLVSGARREGMYTFLLFGTDKAGTNTDTIMVVSYDVKNQKLNLMSIPRDTMVNVPWDIKKINSVYGMRGITGFQTQIAKLIGFTPDYYVKIDLQAFVDVVDLIGGVTFDVPIPMHYHDPAQNLSIDLDPGVQLLNGEQAMGLVRFRKSDRTASGKITGYDDTGRIATQQAFLKEMFKQCLQIKNWTKIAGYVEIFQKNVESDLTLGNMLWFARQAMDLSEGGFNTCTAPGNTGASAYSRSTGGMQSYVTIYAREMVQLVNESFNPYLTSVTTANLDIMGVNADGSVYSSTGYVADAKSAQPVPRPAASDDAQTTPSGSGTSQSGKGSGTSQSGGETVPPDETTPIDAEAPVDETAPDTQTPVDEASTDTQTPVDEAPGADVPPADDTPPAPEPEPQPVAEPEPQAIAPTEEPTPTSPAGAE